MKINLNINQETRELAKKLTLKSNPDDIALEIGKFTISKINLVTRFVPPHEFTTKELIKEVEELEYKLNLYVNELKRREK